MPGLSSPRAVPFSVFWWPSSLVYFIPPAFLLLVAVYVLARHEPQHPPASTLHMLGMPVLWTGVGTSIGLGPGVVFVGVLTPLYEFLDFLSSIALGATILFGSVAGPMVAVALATARLGTPALSRLMRWMAVAGGAGMLAMLVCASLAVPIELVKWLAALAGSSCCSVAALALAPRAHLAKPRTQPPPGMCPACGYDATGLTRCPECGVDMPKL